MVVGGLKAWSLPMGSLQGPSCPQDEYEMGEVSGGSSLLGWGEGPLSSPDHRDPSCGI